MQFLEQKIYCTLFSQVPFFKQRRFSLFIFPATEPAEERQRPAQDGERGPRQTHLKALHWQQVRRRRHRSPSPDVLLIDLLPGIKKSRRKRKTLSVMPICCYWPYRDKHCLLFLLAKCCVVGFCFATIVQEDLELGRNILNLTGSLLKVAICKPSRFP